MLKLRHLVIAYHGGKPDAPVLAEVIARAARQAGLTVAVTSAYPLPTGTLDGADACCAVGGDGTLLGVVPEAARVGVPVLGVNLGKLGFMASFSSEEACAGFEALFRGAFMISQRTLLEVTANDGRQAVALNDLVIRQRASRLVRIHVHTAEELVNSYSADGLIVCTPTGSTAYNLSAGGPLIHPEAPVLGLTPICPHTVSNRSVALPDTVTLRLELEDAGSAEGVSAVTDGRIALGEAPQFPLLVRRAPRTLPLIHAAQALPFRIIRAKLGWG